MSRFTHLAALAATFGLALPLAAATSTSQTRLTSSSGRDDRAVYAGGGSRIFFTSERTGASQVFVMNADGSGVRQVTSSPGGVSSFDASPDGTRIAFVAVDAGGEADVYVVHADGSGLTNVSATVGADLHPAWSPDGARIAFASDRHYPDGRSPELFVMDADGGCVTPLTLGPGDVRHPAWRPGTGPVGRGPCGVRLAPYHDTVDVRRVRVRGAVPLYPGRAFEGMRLVDAEDDLIRLDECDIPDPARCIGEIQLQSFTACRRNPAVYDIPIQRIFRLRGALVVQYDRASFDLMSGGTTTAIYGMRSRAMLERLVAALRPVRGPENLDRPLPRARLPRRAWRRLRSTARLREDSIIGSRREMVRSDRRALRAFRRHGSRAAPACD